MSRQCDGLVCLGGGDWWYHNRGHYDMQMLRHLRKKMPVLYVNSIGVRVPSPNEGRVFLHRVARKLRSLARGLVRVEPSFATFSPFVVPGRRGMALTGALLGPQVRRAARRVGIRNPLLWITCPPGAVVLEALEPAGVVYQRTDRWECFPHSDREQMLAYDRTLKENADAILYCSRLLYEEEKGLSPTARYVDHGVDYDVFAEAGRNPTDDPPEFAGMGRPRVGFVGGVDAHTFDPQLFLEVARRLPAIHFAVVGACSLPADWCTLPNVRQIGRVAYERVARYMAACDILIMPWRQNEWINACNPVKLKEYLAIGRPVISTPFAELEHYADHVSVASDAASFAAAIEAAIASPGDAEARRARVRAESWESRGQRVLAALEERGVTLRAPSGH